ncbi:MAG TPA: (2Fe-2S)-binding protein [Bryobacteraceae bacterium]|nr:(2Fe-2S)-binding protein [Bryobacteraceae bacterium]
MAISFEVNGQTKSVDVDPQTPLMWVLRDTLNLTGTKYGCGIAACGACTVHIDGEPARSCVFPVASVAGKKVTTIEGLANGHRHPVQEAWIAEQAVQCGYCQSGQIMTAVAFLKKNPAATAADVDEAMSNNICRCGTAQRMRAAVLRAAEAMRGKGSANAAGGGE